MDHEREPREQGYRRPGESPLADEEGPIVETGGRHGIDAGGGGGTGRTTDEVGAVGGGSPGAQAALEKRRRETDGA